MAINVSQAFKRTSANPIDESLALTKVQMKAVNDNLMPVKWFTIGQEDGKIYLYDKSNTVDETTGKFRVFEGGGGGASSMSDLTDVLLTSLQNGQTLVWDGSKWVNSDMPTVPTKVSELTNDSGFISSETDPTVPSWAKQSSKPSYTKSEVGLGNVDNTSDANKPVSTAQQTALDAKQNKMQYQSLPTASVDYAGKVFEYVGATENGLTHGYFYECKESNGTYSWVQTNVQPSGGGGGSYTAGDGISIENDEISIDPMPAEDVDEVIDVYPTAGELVSIVNAFNRGDLYSTDEKMIGQFIDGKPLYQKTFSGTTPSTVNTSTDFATGLSSLNIEDIITIDGYLIKPETSTNNTYRRVNSLGWSVWANRTAIRQTQSDSSYLNLTAYVILTYTKTTDTAISIGEATEYSAEEKIVGTWLNGEPIYQRTIVDTVPSTETYGVNVSKDISLNFDVEHFIDCSAFLIESGCSYRFYPIIDISNNIVAYGRISLYNYSDSSGARNIVKIRNAITASNDAPIYITIRYTKHISS